VAVINKIDTADYGDINTVRANVQRLNPRAIIVDAASPIFVSNPDAIRGKRVLVIEDGPTLTHGEMHYGAGMIAAQRFGAAEIVDPRPYAVGSLLEMYTKYPHLSKVLPAMGYGEQQVAELEAVLYNVDAEVVIAATPIDLSRVVRCHRPVERVRYDLQVIGQPTLRDIVARLMEEKAKV
jgi:predicted GTPase